MRAQYQTLRALRCLQRRMALERSLSEHKSIESKDKAQNIPQSSPGIQIENWNMAKKVGKAATTHQMKPIQARKPWSETETETLLKLIERHGTSWKVLKERDVGKCCLQKPRLGLAETNS